MTDTENGARRFPYYMTGKKDIHKTRVLSLGPDESRHSGLSVMVKTYRKYADDFTYIPICRRSGLLRAFWNYIRMTFMLPVYRMKGYGILHFHVNAMVDLDYLDRIRKWGSRLGYVSIYHSHDYTRLNDAFLSGKARKTRGILHSFDAVIAASHKLKEHLEQRGGCKNVYMVPNIADPINKLRNRSKRRNDEPLRLLYMSPLTKERGIFDLIEAMRGFKEYETQLQLTVAGDGEFDAVNDAVEDAGLEKMVRFTGWVEGQERDRILRLNDVMVIPSREETLPVNILEAGVYSMPVIISQPDMIGEYFKDGVSGISVAKESPESIAGAIRHYLDAPDDIPRHGFGASAIIEDFMPDRVLGELNKIYDELLSWHKQERSTRC